MGLSGSMERKQNEGKKKEGKKKIGVISLVLKQCLLIQFLHYSSFDNTVLINLLAVTNGDIKSTEVKFLL